MEEICFIIINFIGIDNCKNFISICKEKLNNT